MAPKPAKSSAIKELHYKYHIFLVMQSEVYVISNIKTEYIELQITWRSVIKEALQIYMKHISVTEDYNKLLQETYEMCKSIIRDAKPFGDAPYWEILRSL